MGVTSFSATVYSTCSDSNGASYSFPAKRTSYSYNQANQLTTGYDYRSVTTSYAYNANGALTRKSDGAGTTGYAYNGLDRLTQVTTPTSTVNYGYDALVSSDTNIPEVK
ncbi:MAG: RHS repeat domain-containing protein [Thermoleophilia bacterium]